jgi:hypothetical protein
MTGEELLDVIPAAIGFFELRNHIPGVITKKNNQAWVFEGGKLNPRPITRSELEQRDAKDIDADYAAELIDHGAGLGFLKKNDKSFTIPASRETNAGAGQTADREMTRAHRESLWKSLQQKKRP